MFSTKFYFVILATISMISCQLKILTFNYPPYAYCSSTARDGPLYNFQETSLLDFELVGGTPTTYTYECLDDNPLTYDFSTRTDDYVASPIMYTNTAAYAEKYTIPIQSSQARVFKKKEMDWSYYYQFIDGIDHFPWITIMMTCVIVAQLLWIFERKSNKKMPKTYASGVYLSLWLSAQLTFFKNGFQIKSIASKILVASYSLFMWKFVILFVVSTTLKVWTSGLLYTSATLTGNAASSVYVDENYATAFSTLGISGSEINWSTKTGETLNTTLNTYSTIAMDINEAIFWNLDLCDYKIQEKPYFSIGVGFMVSTPTFGSKQAELITLLDDGINLNFHNTTKNLVQVSPRDFADYRYNQTWYNQEVCSDLAYQPTMDNTSGIWIFLAIGVALSFMTFLILKLMQMFGVKLMAARRPARYDDVRASEKALVQYDLIQCFDEVVNVYMEKHKGLQRLFNDQICSKENYQENFYDQLQSCYNTIDKKP